MKLEDQVCTREQAERINDLLDGSEDIKTAFYWRYPTNKWMVEPDGYFNPNDEEVEWFPAYTVSELMKMLWMDLGGNLAPSLTYYHGWMDKENINHKTAASLHAALLILFLEEKVFTPEEVSNRLK